MHTILASHGVSPKGASPHEPPGRVHTSVHAVDALPPLSLQAHFLDPDVPIHLAAAQNYDHQHRKWHGVITERASSLFP